jgi:hypothetical protein
MQDEQGYCEHGKYVGGCGIDWMCGYCEDGISWEDFQAIEHYHIISKNCKGEGHMFDLLMRSLWEHHPAYRQAILAALAGGSFNGLNGAHYYDAYIYEELAIAKANLALVRLGLEPVK